MRSRLRLSLAVLTVALGATGCVVVASSDSRYRSGPLNDFEVLNAIEPGKTTKAWVLENLGPPASAYANDAGNEVLRYISLRERETELAVFLLFAVDLSGEDIKTMHIEFESGRVKAYWIE
ncbi:MAG: hypothetical protein OXS50_04685 [Gammaproteobacteria bacterium]|nr:hypothetical protein [Gammaproteobacteria bacterium]